MHEHRFHGGRLEAAARFTLVVTILLLSLALIPVATAVHYQFPARGAQPPVKLSWYDGGLYPPRPDVLPDDVTLKSEGGVIFIGEKGILMNDTYGANPRLFPMSLTEAASLVPKTYARSDPSSGRKPLGDFQTCVNVSCITSSAACGLPTICLRKPQSRAALSR